MSLPVTPFAWIQSVPQATAAHLPVQLATFGVGDTLLIVVVALIVFGPKKLPEISRQLGKLVFEFRKASNDFKFQIEEELRSAEQAERQKQMQAQAATPQLATPVAMTAEETVSAQPEAVSAENTILPPTILTPTIQPPSSGLPVESERPYGGPASPEPEALAVSASPAEESPDEMQANAQAALRIAGSEPSDATSGDGVPAEAVPTHHG